MIFYEGTRFSAKGKARINEKQTFSVLISFFTIALFPTRERVRELLCYKNVITNEVSETGRVKGDNIELIISR